MKILLVIITAMIITGCSLGPPERAIPKFPEGSLIVTKLGAHKGQVVDVNCFPKLCIYDVRFDSPQLKTDTRLFGSDGPTKLQPLSVIKNMREYELQAAE